MPDTSLLREAAEVASDANAWPQIVTIVRGAPFLASALATGELVTTLVQHARTAGQEPQSFVLGTLLFEALAAFDTIIESPERFSELTKLVAPKPASRSAGSPAFALPQPGAALMVAKNVILNVAFAADAPNASIAKQFATDVLAVCQAEEARIDAARTWKTRLGRRFLALCSPALGRIAENRIKWSPEELARVRAGTYDFRAKRRTDLNEFDDAGADFEQAVHLLGGLPADHERDVAIADTWYNIGETAYRARRFKDSLAALSTAVDSCEKLRTGQPEPQGIISLAECLAVRAKVHFAMRDMWGSLADQNRRIELMSQPEFASTHHAASAWIARGTTHAESSRFLAAVDDLSRGIELGATLVALGDSGLAELARARINRGMAYVRLQRFEDAVADLSDALEMFETGPLRTLDSADVQIATALHNRGNAFAGQGRTAAALIDFDHAIDLLRRRLDSDNVERRIALATVFRDRGVVHLDTHSLDAAVSDLGEWVRLHETVTVSPENEAEYLHRRGHALAAMCAALLEAGQLDAALTAATEAVDAYRHLVNVLGHSDLRLYLASALLNRGRVHERAGRTAEAEKDVTIALQAIRSLAAAGDSADYVEPLGRALAALGQLKVAADDPLAAAPLFEEAAEVREQSVPFAYAEQDRQVRRASYAHTVGELISVACRLAESPDVPLPEPSSERGCTWAQRAAYWAERSRARNLAEIMSTAQQKPQGVSETDYEQYERDMTELRDIDFRLRDLETERHRAAEAAQLGGLDADLATARQRRASLLSSIREARARFVARDATWAPGAEPLRVGDIRDTARKLDAGLLTIRPWLQGTNVILVTRTGNVFARTIERFSLADAIDLAKAWAAGYDAYRRTPWWHRDFEKLQAAWHDAIDIALDELGAKLWDPLRPWLAELCAAQREAETQAPALLLLPGLLLGNFPISAARCPDGIRIGDEYRMSVAPSVAVVARGARSVPPDFSLLAVRNPTGHASSTTLMWSEVEVDDICRLAAEHVILSDSADQVLEPATRDRLKRELPKHAVALLSTHGVSDAASPWTGSGLYTADFDVHRGRDGLLTIRDFYEIDLSGAALLLLTACESAIADTDDPTGEQLGLPSAILAAGGSTVIGSLWLVEDLATALLVRQLFIEMTGGRSRSVNVSAGLALWRAQRWLRDLTRCGFDELLATLEHRGNPLPPDVIEGTSRLLDTRGPQPFSRPVFWASFQCYGAP